MECTKCSRPIFRMADRRAQQLPLLLCRETRWWKSTASPPSPSERQRSFVHGTQVKVESPRFSRQLGGDRGFGCGAAQVVRLESWSCGRDRPGERFWANRQSV